MVSKGVSTAVGVSLSIAKELGRETYCLPSFSIFGSHVQRSFSGMGSRTMGTWDPHPHHVAFWQVPQVACLHILFDFVYVDEYCW